MADLGASNNICPEMTVLPTEREGTPWTRFDIIPRVGRTVLKERDRGLKGLVDGKTWEVDCSLTLLRRLEERAGPDEVVRAAPDPVRIKLSGTGNDISAGLTLLLTGLDAGTSQR